MTRLFWHLHKIFSEDIVWTAQTFESDHPLEAGRQIIQDLRANQDHRQSVNVFGTS